MLQRDDRADGERALHELRRMVREAAVANLALVDEAHHLAPRLLDWDGRIGIVRLEQVDVIGAQPAQTGLEVAADRLRAQVHVVVAVVAAQRAALREDVDVVAAAADRLADELLGAAPAVEGSRVDPVDAHVERRADRCDRVASILRAPAHPPGGIGADRRGAHADARDLEVARAEPPRIHRLVKRLSERGHACNRRLWAKSHTFVPNGHFRRARERVTLAREQGAGWDPKLHARASARVTRKASHGVRFGP